jgi:hypothetical protein
LILPPPLAAAAPLEVPTSYAFYCMAALVKYMATIDGSTAKET